MATSGQDRWLFTTELGLQAWSHQKDENPLFQQAFVFLSFIAHLNNTECII
jgi:hypothetical protein